MINLTALAVCRRLEGQTQNDHNGIKGEPNMRILQIDFNVYHGSGLLAQGALGRCSPLGVQPNKPVRLRRRGQLAYDIRGII